MTKFLIITSQRSGSNFLRNSLNSHPKVICDGELLIGGTIPLPLIFQHQRLAAKVYRYARARAWNPAKLLADFLARSDAPVTGFKAMYNHLANRSVRLFLQRHAEIRIIHLRRDNLLKQYVSNVLLGVKRNNQWKPHSTEKLPIVTTRVSPAAAIKAMQRTQKKFAEFEKLLMAHDRIELVYENMIDDGCLRHRETARLCRLLDIEYHRLCCDSVKLNPDRLELIVDNYKELASALKNTPFESFLD